ncbi:unnamed protein product [Linum tenue]|uniref:Uncharacterized protein n=1 Tax=Linum tenue TaxID=586396 RepID=A0AAV0JIY0_9ROSI|nr:unnamed protein product [Linum tenue]
MNIMRKDHSTQASLRTLSVP